MKIKTSELISELQKLTEEAKSQVEKFKDYSIENLNYKANETEWSILECCEHLCLYGNYYLPEIESRIINSSHSKQEFFKSGLLGDYFVSLTIASNTKKMKAVKQMDSTGSKLNISTLDQLKKQLEWLVLLLDKAENVDLRKVKTSISLTKLVKLRAWRYT